MANGLIPRKRNRDFWQNLLPPEQREDEGLFGLDRYQPLPEFERPTRRRFPGGGYPIDAEPGGYPIARAPRMQQPELRAPAPMLQQPGETSINGGDVPGVRTDTLKPLPAYGEEYRGTHTRPERKDEKYLVPAPGLKRGLLGIGLGALAGLSREPGAAARTAGNVFYGPSRRKERQYQRDVEEYEGGLEEARERDIGAGRQARERRAQEAHERYESPEDEIDRRTQEAEAQGLTGEAARRYILTGRMAQPDRPDTSTTAIELWAEAIEREKKRPPTSAEIVAYKKGIERGPSAAGKALAERTKQRAMERGEKEYRKKITALEKGWQQLEDEERNWVNLKTGEQMSNDDMLALRDQAEDELAFAKEQADESYLAQIEALGFEPGRPVDYRAPQEGQAAINPETGERIVVKGGKWVPVPK